MTSRAAPIAVVMLLAAAACTSAQAQPAGGFPRAHALEVDLGAAWLGGVDFGGIDATLTRNQSSGAPYTLFSTSSRLQSAAALEGRVGFRVTRALAVEGAFSYARPVLETSVTADAEGAAATTARETLSRFGVDVSGVFHFSRVRLGRAVPFVLGGAGYLRELHEGDVLVETGWAWHAGGGLKIPLAARRGFIDAIGLRVDGRVYVRSGGVDLDRAEPSRVFGSGGASLLLEF